MFENETFVELKKQISNSTNQDLNEITDVYKKTHDINSVIGHFLTARKDFPKSESPALTAVLYVNPHLLHETNRNSLIIPIRNGIYGRKLENEFSNENLIKYQFENADYLYGNKGVRSASKFYFDKNLSELNKDEKLTLIFMLDNPSLYNPKRHPDRVEKKLKTYREILNK